METASIRLPGPLYSAISQEADDRGMSFSEYAREQLRQRDPAADLPPNDDRADLRDLAERVARIEAELGLTTEPPEQDTSPSSHETAPEAEVGVETRLLDVIRGDTPTDEILSKDTAAERQAVEAALYPLLASGGAEIGVLVESVDIPPGHSREQLAEDLLTPALERLADCGEHLTVDGDTVRAHPEATPGSPRLSE